MSNDYTPRKEEGEAFALPPLPKSYIHMGLHVWNERNLRDYGHACAEAARAPLAEENARLKEQIERMDTVMEGMRSFWNEDHEGLEKARARIAELEAENQTLTRECSDAEDESDRLRAEVEALKSALSECADDLEAEVNARASAGELPRRIERDLEPVRKARALLAQSNKEPTSE